MDVEFCQKLFMHQLIWLWIIHLQPTSMVDYTYFWTPNQPYIHGINFTSSWLIIILYIVGSNLLLSLKIFVCINIHERYWFIVFHFSKAETPVLWLPHAKSWVIGKDLDAGKDWGQEEKGTTEDEMAGWHHWLDGHESEWTPGVGDGQGGLACRDSWGHKESDTTERLIWSDLIWMSLSGFYVREMLAS